MTKLRSARTSAFVLCATTPVAQSCTITASQNVHCTIPSVQYHILCAKFPSVGYDFGRYLRFASLKMYSAAKKNP